MRANAENVVLRERILEALKNGPLDIPQLRSLVKNDRITIYNQLRSLLREHKVISLPNHYWALK